MASLNQEETGISSETRRGGSKKSAQTDLLNLISFSFVLPVPFSTFHCHCSLFNLAYQHSDPFRLPVFLCCEDYLSTDFSPVLCQLKSQVQPKVLRRSICTALSPLMCLVWKVGHWGLEQPTPTVDHS